MEYTWTIQAMYVIQQPEPNYVVNVSWTITGTDGEYTASSQADTILAVNDEQSDYIPYADLTEAIVINWVQEALGPTGIHNYESGIVGQIEAMKNPPVSPEQAPLPWAN